MLKGCGGNMAASIDKCDVPPANPPMPLFKFERKENYSNKGYDVARNGMEFIIVVDEPENAPITVVRNWWVELERRKSH